MNAPLQLAGYGPLPAPPLLVVREDVEPETVADWKVAHEHLVALGVERASRERDVCRWLLAAERLGNASRAGFASLAEYAERVLGLKPRETEERLRMGRELSRLPVLDAALAEGELHFTSVREITRVATPETDREWREFADGKRTREVTAAVAGRRKGARPTERADPKLRRHRLSFEVKAETMAMFRDLQAAVRADLGGDADDDAVLLEIARRGLGGPTDPGRASYQVAVSRCDSCRVATIDAGGERHEVDEVTAERMECDAQHIGNVDRPREGAARATQTIPPATRRQVMRRDDKRCIVPGCFNYRYLDAHHLRPKSEGGSHDADNLVKLCGAHHDLAHHGTLVIDGTPSRGLTFRHADGTPYGQPLRPAAVDIATQVLGALRQMGIRATRARQLIDIVQRQGAPDDLTEFIRAALRAQ